MIRWKVSSLVIVIIHPVQLFYVWLKGATQYGRTQMCHLARRKDYSLSMCRTIWTKRWSFMTDRHHISTTMQIPETETSCPEPINNTFYKEFSLVIYSITLPLHTYCTHNIKQSTMWILLPHKMCSVFTILYQVRLQLLSKAKKATEVKWSIELWCATFSDFWFLHMKV